MSKQVEKVEEEKVEEKVEDAQKETPSAETKNTEEHSIPKSRFDEVNQKYKDAMKRADALEKAANEAETKRLKESEDYKALYEKSQATIAELQPKADGADNALATLKEVLAAQIEAIPEAKRGLIPDELSTEKQLAWIAKNRQHLSKAQPFDIGAGEMGGSGSDAIALTPAQREMAKKLGVSEKSYAEQLKQKAE